MPLSRCPGCGAKLDAARAVDADAASPDPGDFSICLDCGHLMAFDDQRMLRDLTDDEMHQIAGDRRVLAVQRARGEAMKAKKRNPS
jgi:hypothetical protein